MGNEPYWMLPMDFPHRLFTLRKRQGLTQQQMADAVGAHVNQIKRYESGTAQPTLENLIGLAKALHVSLDELVFEDYRRGPNEELRLQFEAITGMNEEEKKVVKEVLHGLILRYESNRWNKVS